MPIFVIQPNEQHSKREMFLNWAFIVIGVVLFFMAFFIKRQVLTILTNSLLALNFVFLGLNRLLNKRNDRFLQIN